MDTNDLDWSIDAAGQQCVPLWTQLVYWSRALADLTVAESVTWYSMEVLARSLAESVGRFRFSWLLPGHGDRQLLPSAEMDVRWRQLAERAATVPSRPIDFTAVRW
nr:hypothetical protein [Kibdelosporangium sp. MJ126-NF4]CEL20247.1 hypothetical protein [Kibdelosporangium sp. MJ126-NF4]CTQ97473.1 hypothetical protein [Kibdelosporangium sp. MJ126-NF4]